MVKHARAQQVTVSLACDLEQVSVRLVVADDGIGFDPRCRLSPSGQPSWGLIAMRERAEAVGGRMQLESRPDQGTRIMVEVTR